MSMTLEEAINWLETYLADYYDAMDIPDDLPCEVAQIALSALCPVSLEQVEKVWKGEWKHYLPPLGAGDIQCRCTRCGMTPDAETPFCAWCGAAMTSEAVDIVMERLEALYHAPYNNGDWRTLKNGSTTD